MTAHQLCRLILLSTLSQPVYVHRVEGFRPQAHALSLEHGHFLTNLNVLPLTMSISGF